MVRIHLPPAESLLRTWLSAYEEVPRARRGKEARMEDGAGPRALAAAERAALARRRGPPSTRTLIEIALKQAGLSARAEFDFKEDGFVPTCRKQSVAV